VYNLTRIREENFLNNFFYFSHQLTFDLKIFVSYHEKSYKKDNFLKVFKDFFPQK